MNSRKKNALGIILLLTVVIIWVGSSTLIQYIFENESFAHPFFLTYYSTSLFSVYLLVNVRVLIEEFRRFRKPRKKVNRYLPLQVDPPENPHVNPPGNFEITEAGKENGRDSPQCTQTEMQGAGQEPTETTTISCFQLLKLSVIFAPIWFAMNYTFNLSLSYTSVSSNTVLSTASAPFTMILCYFIIKEKFSIANALGVFCTVAGAFLIGFQDTETQTSTIYGDALAVLSAFVYATYSTLMKYKLVDDDNINMSLFFGFIGLFNLVFCLPLLLILSVTNIEHFEFPSMFVFGMLTANGFFSVISDYLWARAILLTSPLVATVGLTLTIPLAFVSDLLLRQKTFSSMYFAGSFMVLLGFVFVNWKRKKQLESEAEKSVAETASSTTDLDMINVRYHDQ